MHTIENQPESGRKRLNQYKKVNHSQSDLSQAQISEVVDRPLDAQQKKRVRIELTTLWTYSKQLGFVRSNKPKVSVYYRKPILTPQGELDWGKLILGIVAPKAHRCR